MIFSKEVNVFLLFCYLPLRTFKQTWIFFIHVYKLALELKLSLFSNLLLSSFAKWRGLSLPKTFFLPCRVFLHLSCLCNLKRTANSGNQAPHPPPFEKYDLYSVPYISWVNYYRVAFGDEAKFSVSVLKSLILIFHIFFLILQDSCKPLCHLQRCKGHLSTNNYVLECFMPSLTEIGSNQDSFHSFATNTSCNEMCPSFKRPWINLHKYALCKIRLTLS